MKQDSTLRIICKYLSVSLIFVIQGTLYLLFILITFIFPGKCDICMRKKINFFRHVELNDKDEPIIRCKICNKNRKVYI